MPATALRPLGALAVRTSGDVSARVRWSGHVHPDPAAMDVDWAELDLVRDWRDFLGAPDRWLRHLSG